MNKSFFIIFSFLIIHATTYAQLDMNNTKMGEILERISDKVEGIEGNWQIIYGEQILFIITDETHNRMRIFTPIADQKEVTSKELEEMLAANFHAALDAKYALYSGFVVSLFTHPLKELTADQFKDAVKQVAAAGQNFGTTYSSTDLIFGVDIEQDSIQNDRKVNEKPKKKTK